MHSGFSVLFAAASSLTLTACGQSGYFRTFPPAISADTIFEQSYDAELVAVSRSQKTQDRYGPQTISTAKDSTVTKFTFEDRLIRAVIIPEDRGIGLRLTNKSEHPIRVRWADAAYVDVVGKSSPVMHVGVRYSDCSGVKSAQVIVQGSSVTDHAVPCSALELHSGISSMSGWHVSRLYPGMIAGPGDSAEKFSSWKKMTIGMKTRFLLPIEVEDVVNDYVFELEAKSVHTVKFDALASKVP